ncbi:MAG: DUF262 domain-containing protein [Gallionella sp.]|nr:DUF262 domain-containing protein [Gallionella sp.]
MMIKTDSNQQDSTASAKLLFLPHIASWQITQKPAVGHRIVAALPALQRGAVWKPQQVEALWDSIVRGFPIGAIFLSPFDKKRGIQQAKYQQEGVGEPNYHLLDGQQRATAIALGFLNPWTATEKVKAVLWVDIAKPHEGSDLGFVFRVLTCSHPWGYNRTDPEKPIAVGNIRNALEAYRTASPEYKSTRPAQFPLTHVWPWDAEASIPLPFLVEEILSDEGADEILEQRLLDRMRKLPFWGDEKLGWQQNVEAMLSGKVALSGRFQSLVDGLRKALEVDGSYGVPVLVLPQMTRADVVKDGQQDPVETLFIRINRSGTPLGGEELIYSILKSTWTDAPKFVEALQHKLAQPSRLVLLCARLVLAAGAGKAEKPPAVPDDVARFRRLIQGFDESHPTFRADLEAFVRRDGVGVFQTAHKLLTEGRFALPPVLACEIAQKYPEVMFLLLRWIQLMRDSGLDPLQISEDRRRQLLGFVTSMAWFAADRNKALTVLWPELRKKSEEKKIKDFFTQTTFNRMLQLDGRAGLMMLPLPSPEKLAKVIQDCVTSARGSGGYGGFGDPNHEFWKKWNRWEWMSGRLTGDIKSWFGDKVSDLWTASSKNDDFVFDPATKYQEAWTKFINSLWNNRSILLYAQRDWLKMWFPDYDPSQPEQLEDMNRPWDFDHIHPQRYLKNEKGNSHQNIPNIVWDWHSSMGNFRAWPLELNRADGDTSPAYKLNEISDDEIRYLMKTPKNARSASFIGEDHDWPSWQESVPSGGDHPRQYLADPANYGACRKKLILAITARFVALYREWYVTLKVDKLMGD